MAFATLFQGTAAPEHVDTLKNALITLARESMNEPGTIRYEFYQLKEDPMDIILFAIWEHEADWKAHVGGDVHQRYVKSLPEGAWAIPPVLTRLQALDDSA